MARQLQRAGREVPVVFLISPPGIANRSWFAKAYSLLAAIRAKNPDLTFAALCREVYARLAKKKQRSAEVIDTLGQDASTENLVARLQASSAVAWSRYQPKPYAFSSRRVLIRSRTEPITWFEKFLSDLEIHVLPQMKKKMLKQQPALLIVKSILGAIDQEGQEVVCSMES